MFRSFAGIVASLVIAAACTSGSGARGGGDGGGGHGGEEDPGRAGAGGDAAGGAGGGGAGGAGGGAGGAGGGGAGGQGGARWLADRHPGDRGIAADPAVVWHEAFEQDSVAALAARYEDARIAGLSLVPDVSPRSSGARSLRLGAGGAAGDASQLYKRLPGDGFDVLHVRYLVRHEVAPYHHSGVWLGGYRPTSNWPNPRAGERPRGDDRLSVGFEPAGSSAGGRLLDFYAYWMNMRSGAGFWYGNSLLQRSDVTTRPGTWLCVELRLALNHDPESAAGGELELWIDDAPVQRYDATGPRGYWIQDRFCPRDADTSGCLDWAPPPAERERDVVDLRWRSTTELRLNWIWILNYISSGSGSLWVDDLVVATERIGCPT